MSDADKQKHLELQAAAWRRISSFHSVAEMHVGRPTFTEHAALLVVVIGEQKRVIERAVDKMED